MPGDPSEPQDRCPRCGASLSLEPDAPCARCLLALGLDGDAAPPAGAQGEPHAPPEGGAAAPEMAPAKDDRNASARPRERGPAAAIMDEP